jgi:hypothetical protein
MIIIYSFVLVFLMRAKDFQIIAHIINLHVFFVILSNFILALIKLFFLIGIDIFIILLNRIFIIRF